METLVELIVQYGIYPVLMALLLFLIIKLSRDNTKTQAKISEQNAKQEDRLSELLEAILKVDKATDVKHTKEDEDDGRRVNNFIELQLSNLLSEEGANRAYLFLYHNGGKDLTGRGFQKMSITNEEVDANTVPLMGSYQSIPRAMFPTLYKKLSSEDVYYIKDVEDIKQEDPVSYQMFLAHGADTILMRAIKRNDGMMTGFVVMEFTSNNCENLEKTAQNLERKVLKITGALINKGEEE